MKKSERQFIQHKFSIQLVSFSMTFYNPYKTL